jgi:hypothetical protein
LKDAQARAKRDAELLELIHEKRRYRVLDPECVYAYAELVLRNEENGGRIEPAAHHKLWIELICDTNIKELLIIAPPESAKTTWMLAYLGARLGFHPEDNHVFASAGPEVAEARSLALRGTVTRPEWQAAFPGIKPVTGAKYKALKWETTQWSLAPEGHPMIGRLHASVSSYGPQGKITGRRATLAIADDLLDMENSRTEAQRALVRTFVHTSFFSRMRAVVGRKIVIGTAWHPEDIYSELRRAGTFVVCHIPMLSESNEVYANLVYPDGWPYPMRGKPVGLTGIQELVA